MRDLLKAELRKIWTLRSTYVILLFSFVIMIIYAFWVEGIKAGETSRAAGDPYKLAGLVRDAVNNLAFWGGLVGILSVTHEYRYNTIMHTLTSSKSRSQTLLAKIAAISFFAILFTVFVSVLATALMYLGISIKGLTLAHQAFPLDLLWQVLFVGWGYSMAGALLAIVIRHQTGSIAAFFIIPAFIETLLGLLLKDNKVYLPFIALQQVATSAGITHPLTHSKAALVFTAYLAIGWVIAWFLFLRRDAN